MQEMIEIIGEKRQRFDFYIDHFPQFDAIFQKRNMIL